MLTRALEHFHKGRLAQAEECCRDAFATAEVAAAFELMGLIAHRRGQVADGLIWLAGALAIAPGRPEPHSNRAAMLLAVGRAEDAIANLSTALVLQPDFTEALRNLGGAALKAGDWTKTRDALTKAVRLDPSDATAWIRLGVAATRLGLIVEAIGCFDRALAIEPSAIWAHFHLGNVRRDKGDLAGATASLAHAMSLDVDFAQAEFSLALSLLMSGRLVEGWRAYESRWRGSGEGLAGNMNKRARHLPEWRGEAVAPEARLLVYKEQGWGDNIMFARYVPMLTGRFAEIAYYCPVPLERLFVRGLGPDITLSSSKYIQREPRFTHAVPLLSLPRVLETDLASVPARVPYLAPLPADVASWRERLAGLARPRIGIAWVGGAALTLRSMTLAALYPLLERRGISWISLSKAASPEERAEAARRGMADPMDSCRDFADTAALVACLDLVISIDTAVAHLAGAMAQPVWLLNRFESDWRWMRGRADSPWYPTMRIFSQPSSGDWDGAVDEIGRALFAEKLGDRP